MKKRIFWFTCTLFIMALIFVFSSQNSDQSSKSSGFIVMLVKLLGDFENIEFIVRKMAHFSIYAALGLSIYQTLKTYPLKSKYIFIFSLIFCFLYACSDEFHQSFSPGRSPQFSDVLIDTSGSLLMISLSSLISSRR